MVVLRHVRDGHPDHFDWLIARDERGERPLWSWRCAADPSTLAPAASMGVRAMADHRTRYLTYEGPISGDRGTVERVAEGTCRCDAAHAGLVTLTLEWTRPPRPSFVVEIGGTTTGVPHIDAPDGDERVEFVTHVTNP